MISVRISVMKKVTLKNIRIYCFLLLMAASLPHCDEENRKKLYQVDHPNSDKTAVAAIFPDSSNCISFDGFKWIAIDSRSDYDMQHFCESDPMNCYVEGSNILNLSTSGEGANKKGIILESDTLLGYGVYSFDLISNINDLKDVAEFTFSLINDDKFNTESVSEIGIKFSYLDTTKSPLSYYVYTTIDKIPYEFFHEGNYPTLDLSKHIIEIDEGFIRLSSFEGFIDYQSSEFFEYVFEFSEKDLELDVPNRIRIRISLCLKPEIISNRSAETNVKLTNIKFTESATYYSRF
jgi:hypothetical protein